MVTVVRNPKKNKWDKVFKNGQSKVCGRQPLKDLKGCLPEISLGPFLNTLSQIINILFDELCDNQTPWTTYIRRSEDVQDVN